MNEIVNQFLLAGDKFIPEMHLKQPGFILKNLLKTRKEFKNLKRKEIQDISTQRSYTKLVFNMIWLMEILNIYQEQHLQIKYYRIKHLILLKIQNTIDIKEVLLLRFLNVLIKGSLF